jgi:hypothetical protein
MNAVLLIVSAALAASLYLVGLAPFAATAIKHEAQALSVAPG